jgi:photosystem II stability/assembly factor-like uncharacterized protein
MAAAIAGGAGVAGRAEVGRWEPIGPEGGRIRALALLPDAAGTVLAGTTGAGVFRSEDHGATWQASSVGITAVEAAELLVDPHDPGRVFFGTWDDGLLRSVDGGRTWQRADAGIQIRPGLRKAVTSLAADPSQPGVFYAGSNSGVYKSVDGGDSWSWLPLVEEVNSVMAIAVNPADPNEVFASLWDAGVHRSADGGATWSPTAPIYPRNDLVADLVFSPTNSNVLYANVWTQGVFATHDHGATWVVLNGDLPDRYLVAFEVASESGLDMLVGGSRNGAFRTRDSGGHWQRLGESTLNDSIGALAIDASDPQRLFAGTWEHGVFASADDGATWVRSVAGMFNSRTQIAFADPTGSGRQFTATPLFLHLREPGSSAWSIIDGLGSLRAVAAAPNGVIYVGGSSVLHRSRDAGRTWEGATDGTNNQDVRELDVDLRDPERVWAVASGALFQTSNGGVLWHPVEAAPHSYLYSVAVSPWRTGHVVATGSVYEGFISRPVVLVTVDDGLTWSAGSLELRVGLSGPVFAGGSPDRLLAGSNAGVYTSVDGGWTWFRANSGDSHECGWSPFYSSWECDDATFSLVVDPTNGNVVYGLRGGRVWRSTDGATSWSAFGEGLPPAFINHLSIAPDGQRLFVATEGAGTWTVETEPTVQAGNPRSPRRLMQAGH